MNSSACKDRSPGRTGHIERSLRAIGTLTLLAIFPVVAATPLLAQPWTAENARSAVPEHVSPAVHAFPYSAVRLLDGPFLDAMRRDARYLFSLDPDRLLHGFYVESGLVPKAEGYAGWEQDGLGGHTLGHYLSAASMYGAASGDSALVPRVRYIVEEMAAIQTVRGDGYAAAIPGGDSLWAQVARRDIATSGFRLNGVWAPWYTMHKQLAGLLDAYWNADIGEALVVARRLADWAIATTAHLDEEDWRTMLACEYGGMNEALANLYAVTGNADYLTLSRRFHDERVLGPLAHEIPDLTGLHGNTQIPKVIGTARQYQLIGDDSLRTIAEFFWRQVVDYHTYVIGGNTMGEYFGEPGQLSDRLDATTAETCNTYNMLRLTRQLFTIEPQARYADYYERALFNHILASQDPEEGMFTYYMSLKPGSFKTYSTPEGAFWCCVGSGMENHVRYGEAIYFHGKEDLWVSLFVASEVMWNDVTLRQETGFPDEAASRMSLRMDEPHTFSLRIRRPSWAGLGYGITVNGVAVEVDTQPGEFVAIERRWKDGDAVRIELPMRLRTESMPDDPGRVALLYGPIVLAGDLGTKGLPEGGAYADSDTEYIEAPVPAVPALVAEGDPASWIDRLPGPDLAFRTVGAGRPEDVTLLPFFRTHHRRYSIYWDLFDETGWSDEQERYERERDERRALEAATLDAVRFGVMLTENERDFLGQDAESGVAFGRPYRQAGRDGWFSLDLLVPTGAAVDLMCTYWGGDRGSSFDVLAGGTSLGTQKLDGDHPGQFFDVRYAVPSTVSSVDERLRLRFAAQNGQRVGRVFECRALAAGR